LEKCMPYKPEHKVETRRRVVEAAARLFNRRGFADVTIGEIMTAAGMTHGGFYRHFANKEELYAEAVRHFLRKQAPARWQKGPKGRPRPDLPFAKYVIDAYLSRDHLEDVEGSCPLIGLSTDVARSNGTVKEAYREVAKSMIDVFMANMNGRAAREQAIVLLSLCVGGMVLARALDDEVLVDDCVRVTHKHALSTAGWVNKRGRPRTLAV
jgi:TetR/AcrR family transcriptional regulator, transcriptional repressor for nem operon